MLRKIFFFLFSTLLFCSCSKTAPTHSHIAQALQNGEIEKAKCKTENYLPRLTKNSHSKQSSWALPTLALLETYQGDLAQAQLHWKLCQDSLLDKRAPPLLRYEEDCINLYSFFTFLGSEDPFYKERARGYLKEKVEPTFTKKNVNKSSELGILHFLQSQKQERFGNYLQAKKELLAASDYLAPEFAQQELQALQNRENSDRSKIIILLHKGIIAPLTLQYSPSSVASKEQVKKQLDELLSPYNRAEVDELWSSIRYVPHPHFSSSLSKKNFGYSFEFDGETPSFYNALDIQQIALDEVERQTPEWIARSVAELLIVKMRANNRFGLIGKEHTLLSDTSLLLSNSFSSVDCKHLSTLPSKIEIATVSAAPGTHHLQFTASHKSYTQEITIAPGDPQLYLLHIFFASPLSVRFFLSKQNF